MRHALAGEHVEHADLCDQRPVSALRRADHVRGGDVGVKQEGEVARDRLQVRGVERRLRQGFALGGWDCIKVELEPCNRSIDTELCRHIRMQFAEHAERDLWPELERA